jgi:pyruvate formate lyase activating enzyme
MKSVATIGGYVFNIQRFSIQDGPGIRTTVFMKGCPLRCAWCSNPESQNPFPEVGHRDSLCTGCGRCQEICEEMAINVTSRDTGFSIRINRERCTNCGKCIDVCMPAALQFCGQRKSVDEVFDEVKKDSLFYSNSGGGVTAGGGEPLNQADFVAELFRRCRRVGIHTTLDTSGHSSASALEKVLAETDLVLFDLKLISNQQHRRFTKKDNWLIYQNVRLVKAKGVPMIIRIPLIPGINDSENLTETADFICELDSKLHVDLLPYHRFGESKYRMLDREYELIGLESPSTEQAEKAAEVFRERGLDCAIQE